MGYYRSLYAGPVFVCHRKDEDKSKANYEVFGRLPIEDELTLLQRHVNLSLPALIGPGRHKYEREFSHEIDEEPRLTLKECDVEAEKAWFIREHQQEFDMLKQYYATVEVDWAIVMDGG